MATTDSMATETTAWKPAPRRGGEDDDEDEGVADAEPKLTDEIADVFNDPVDEEAAVDEAPLEDAEEAIPLELGKDTDERDTPPVTPLLQAEMYSDAAC